MSSHTLGHRIADAGAWTPAHEAALDGRDRDGLWPTWVYAIIGEEDVDGRPLGMTAVKSAGVTRIPPDRRGIRA
ncbi:MAG: hypothetical protein GEV11_29790 [Streptosporangiales bacterium]|nr:hypothetical protein [Streptosporangiales bacterium]